MKLFKRYKALSMAFACFAAPLTLSGCHLSPEPTHDEMPDRGHDPVYSDKIIAEERKIISSETPISRALTQDEAKLLKFIFKDKLDTSQIRINFYNTRHSRLVSNVPDGNQNEIHVYGTEYASFDYSQDNNPFLFGILMYESMRLAQNQDDLWQHNKSNSEDYILHEGLQLDFFEYGRLHQAAMLEDYMLRFYHPSRSARVMSENYGFENCSADDALAIIIEDEFPQLRQLRESERNKSVRKMTRDEYLLSHAIFGDKIQYKDIRLHMEKKTCSSRIASVNNVKDISFWGAYNWSSNFATDHEPDDFGAFVHEMTHIWQFQHNFNQTNFKFVNEGDAYSYPLNIQKWNFDDYGAEQQGAIVQDYSTTFLRSEGWARRTWNEEGKRQLKILVEDKFPNAKKSRIYFERHGVLPGQKTTVSYNSRPAS